MSERIINAERTEQHAVFEELLEDISFNAGGDEMPDVYLNINAEYVREHLTKLMNVPDPHKYIL